MRCSLTLTAKAKSLSISRNPAKVNVTYWCSVCNIKNCICNSKRIKISYSLFRYKCGTSHHIMCTWVAMIYVDLWNSHSKCLHLKLETISHQFHQFTGCSTQYTNGLLRFFTRWREKSDINDAYTSAQCALNDR